jgi:hypothetical protein
MSSVYKIMGLGLDDFMIDPLTEVACPRLADLCDAKMINICLYGCSVDTIGGRAQNQSILASIPITGEQASIQDFTNTSTQLELSTNNIQSFNLRLQDETGAAYEIAHTWSCVITLGGKLNRKLNV